ncbi:translation initiation factor eIF-2B subunit epsilon [Phlebotomus argentipes]|uniref:translation initiation factor eIF-2B subunit epsilon n=1 Tax=Phlebotomus argentipes TaxID=94469 RepID=UPI0028937E3A|nr:translation initiation factor eIF-2B subunit epsilon [Phlebotomus argentipes]
MEKLEKKEISQALIVADNFTDNFAPFTDTKPLALLPIVNVPFLDYAIEFLNFSRIEETFIVVSNGLEQVRSHIEQRLKEYYIWSVKMTITVIGSEGSHSVGDVLRDIDAKGLIRGHFILMTGDTISNVNMIPLLERHKQIAKFDKGACMTVLYMELPPEMRTGDEVTVAVDRLNNRLLTHQRQNPLSRERKFSFGLEYFKLPSGAEIRHDYGDPQIAICSPTVLPLFADNFDFETRDDFIRGLLINEEILDSRIYVAELSAGEYAMKVSNWQKYKMVSNDIIHRWTHPLSPDMGIGRLKLQYNISKNLVYKNKSVQLARSSVLKGSLVIHEASSVGEKSWLSDCVVGKRCRIGNNCKITNSFIFDDVTVEDNCRLDHCVLGQGCIVKKDSTVTGGAVCGDRVILPEKSSIDKLTIQSTAPEFSEPSQKLGKSAFVVLEERETDAQDSDDDDKDITQTTVKRMAPTDYADHESDHSSSSDEEESQRASPVPEDANIFLSEVIDSLKRGFEEKSNPEFLVLEINSSRYAYNMSLSEVNFYVVQAIFHLSPLAEATTSVLAALKQIYSHLGPVLKNYIKGEAAMHDCLKAIQDICQENSNLKPRVSQIVHFFYDEDLLSEEAIVSWHEDLGEDAEWLREGLKKLIVWFQEASSDESSD